VPADRPTEEPAPPSAQEADPCDCYERARRGRDYRRSMGIPPDEPPPPAGFHFAGCVRGDQGADDEAARVWSGLRRTEQEYLEHVVDVGAHAANERWRGQAIALQRLGLLTEPDDRMYRRSTALGKRVTAYGRSRTQGAP
jgi:hypothetical protein